MNILNFLNKNKKNIFFIVFLIWVLFFDVWFADQAATPWQQPESWANSFLKVINEVLKVVVLMVWVLTSIVWYFLSPGWTTWLDLWFTPKLKDMWILVSNVVYFIFAFLFIWIAFMNIIWKDGDTYQLKQAIPRFIIWVLIVPFSWLIVQFTISIAWILSAAVLSLPFDSFPEFNVRMERVNICNNANLITEWNSFKFDCEDNNRISFSEILNTQNGVYSILLVYTYGIFGLESIMDYTQSLNSTTSTLVHLAWHMWFSALMLVVYFLLLVSLFLALFVRWIYMWLFSVMSPVFGLLFFFKKDSWEWVLAKFNFKQFISLAFVPVYVSAALSFGLLFIYVAWTWLSQENSVNFLNISEPDPDGKSDITIWSWDNTIKMTTDIRLLWGEDEIVNAFLSGGVTIWNTIIILLMQVFWLVILRIWVMAALRSSEITKEITEPIYQFGKSMWELASKAPTYAPILPWKDWPISAAWLWAAGQSFKTSVEWTFTSRWSEFGQWVASNFGFWNREIDALRQAMARYHNLHENTEVQERTQAYRAVTDSVNMEQLRWNRRLREEFVKSLEQIFGTQAVASHKAAILSGQNLDTELARFHGTLNGNHLSVAQNVYWIDFTRIDGVSARLNSSGASSWRDSDSNSSSWERIRVVRSGTNPVIIVWWNEFVIDNIWENGQDNNIPSIVSNLSSSHAWQFNKDGLRGHLTNLGLTTQQVSLIITAVEQHDREPGNETKILRQQEEQS